MHQLPKMKIVVLSGAGMSAESGVQTFRDSNGLWENHKIEDVARPGGFKKDPQLVLDFYNQRRKQLFEVEPNAGHLAIAQLEKWADVMVITQNVDDLHERAGSTKVMHLHGELRKVRSTQNEHIVLDWLGDLGLADRGPDGHPLRPHIVWFHEAVPLIDPASKEISKADRIIVVGSSMQVYPAAGLVSYARRNVPIWYVDPNPQLNSELEDSENLTVIAEKAGTALPKLLAQWQNQ
jgi:NAD-dependent deacetylase